MNKICFCIKFVSVLVLLSVLPACQAEQGDLQLRTPDSNVLFVFDSDKSNKTYSVFSPDKSVEVRISAAGGLQYSVLLNGEVIVNPSGLSLLLDDDLETGIDVTVESELSSHSNKSWQMVCGPRKTISDNYNQIVLNIKENASDLVYALEFRAYDEGAAFRYVFPKTNTDVIKIKEEFTEFNFAGNYTCWPTFYGSYSTMQEKLYVESTLSDILPGSIVGLPLTVDLGARGYCSIAEAALVDYAGSYLTTSGAVELYSSPELNGNSDGVKVSVDLQDNASQLMLKVDSLGSINFDHVDIAEAKLIRADGTYIWLSDQAPVSARQDWGSLHINESVDGNPITINGQQYQKGLGCHANAAITYNVDPEFVRLECIVGIDSEVESEGSAQVSVFANAVVKDSYSICTTLSRQQEQAVTVDLGTSGRSPWRVIMLGNEPVDLLNSDIIVNLNEASKITDTSWITPGVASWNWLTTYHGLTMDAIKGFIDLSSQMNWEYALVDDGWYKNGNCTTSQDFMDIPALVQYAAQRNVKVWLWVHWEALNARMDQAMALYESWGIAGIKVDFMSRDDQWMVDWYHQVLGKAASHKLMVNFHGCYKPAGVRRTWPNLITREAVYGLEQNFSTYNDPVHKTILPFTRMLVGPMDYTPGSFNNESRSTWSNTTPVSTLGTRCQELALCLIYDSPIVNMAGNPEGYYGQPGADFLNGLPTSWDNTIALDGKIGKYYVSARQIGNNWYIGGITNWDARTMQIPLDFLASGQTYSMTIYEDGLGAFSDNFRDVSVRKLSVDSSDNVAFNLASGGGFTAILTCSE